MQINKLSWLFGIFLFACNDLEHSAKSSDYLAEFRVTFEHRGNLQDDPITDTLMRSKENEYFMDVKSVFCGEDVCKVDPVRLFWNKLGIYQRFTLPPNIKLEKGTGEDFTDIDNIKLNRILANPRNGLGDLSKDELLNDPVSGNAVDAMSGATVAINVNDYVKGAIWTSYTLWHFAHGELTQIIRDKTGDSLTLDELHHQLSKGKAIEKDFALEQLIRRNAIDTKTRQQVIAIANHHPLHALLINYLSLLPDQAYIEDVKQLLSLSNSALTERILKALSVSQRHLPQVDIIYLLQFFQDNTEYATVRSLLSIIEQNYLDKTTLIDHLLPYLSSHNFLIARKAYWALEQMPLSEQQKTTLTKFYNQHNEKL